MLPLCFTERANKQKETKDERCEMRDLYFHKPIDEYVQSASLWHKDTSLGRFITLLPQIRLLTRLCYSFYEVSNPVLYPDEL